MLTPASDSGPRAVLLLHGSLPAQLDLQQPGESVRLHHEVNATRFAEHQRQKHASLQYDGPLR